MAGLALSTPAEFRGFLVSLKRDAQITDFLDVVGKDLVRSGVLREAEFSLKDPDRLQKAKLKARLIDSGVKIDDISTDVRFRNQPDDWWEEHGALLASRIQAAWDSQVGGGAVLGDAMVAGQVLSERECKRVVEDSDMSLLEKHLQAQDQVEIKNVIQSGTEFGRLFQRGWLNFRESAKQPTASKTDFWRPRLNQAFMGYTRLWTGTLLPDILAERYTRRISYPPRFFDQLLSELAAFAAGRDIEECLIKAMSMLAELSTKELGSCGVSFITKALGAVLAIFHSMLDGVGPAAGQRAQDVLDVWTEVDSRWEQYGLYYESAPGHEPLACTRAFVFPVIVEWLNNYWARLIRSGAAGEAGQRLEEALDLDEMRGRPRLGIRHYEERAADIRISARAKRAKGTPTNTPPTGGALPGAGPSGGAAGGLSAPLKTLMCGHCGKAGHTHDTCYKLHPEKNPKGPEGKAKAAALKNTKAQQSQMKQQTYAQQFYQQQMFHQQQTFQQQQQQQQQPPQQQQQQQQQQRQQSNASPIYQSPGLQPPPGGGGQVPLPPGVLPMGAGAPMPPGAPGTPGGMRVLKLCFKCGLSGHIAVHCPTG